MKDARWLVTDEERHVRGMGPWTRIDDPAHILLTDDFTTTPVVYRSGCYICEDPEFAQMGLPLCKPCPRCMAGGRTGHMAADDPICDDCGYSMYDHPSEWEDYVRDYNGVRS